MYLGFRKLTFLRMCQVLGKFRYFKMMLSLLLQSYKEWLASHAWSLGIQSILSEFKWRHRLWEIHTLPLYLWKGWGSLWCLPVYSFEALQRQEDWRIIFWCKIFISLSDHYLVFYLLLDCFLGIKYFFKLLLIFDLKPIFFSIRGLEQGLNWAGALKHDSALDFKKLRFSPFLSVPHKLEGLVQIGQLNSQPW